jgi:hypothetical protein
MRDIIVIASTARHGTACLPATKPWWVSQQVIASTAHGTAQHDMCKATRMPSKQRYNPRMAQHSTAQHASRPQNGDPTDSN